MIMSKNLVAALLMLLSYNAWSAAFSDNGDGTVTDFATGLTWQQSDAHNNIKRTQSAAIVYCDGLTLAGGGWRLPAAKELISIVDFRRVQPSINLSYFPDGLSTPYWTASSFASDSDYGWIVSFWNGDMFEDEVVFADEDVRCVR